MPDLTPEALDQLEATAKAAYEVIPYRESTHWHWSGDTSGGYPRLTLSAWVQGHGRCTLMDFTRWGMQSAGPRFPDAAMMMQDARTRVTFEVGQRGVVGQKAAELDPSVYRYDVTGVSHPVAEHITAADPATILALIAEVRRMRADWLREATSRDELLAKIERLRDACRNASQDDWGLEYLYVSAILRILDGGDH